jgi:hypothetical protein
LHVPIRNPSGQGTSRRFVYRCTIDRYEPSRALLIDWKTTGDVAAYIARKAISVQLDLYALALEQHGHRVDSIEFRLVSRPTIKLKAKQTPLEYLDECREWLAAPGKIVEHSLLLSQQRIEGARRMLWEYSQARLAQERSGYHMRNEGNCFQWGRACPYLHACECLSMTGDSEAATIKAVSDQYSIGEPETHEGKEIVRYSSIAAWMSCQQLHRWQYALAMRPIREQESEALDVGNRFHEAIALAARDGEQAAIDYLFDRASRGCLGNADVERKRQGDAARVAAMILASLDRWPDCADGYEPPKEGEERERDQDDYQDECPF